MSKPLQLALIGAGHLGGSFALALREAGAEVTITAYDADRTQSALLHARGAVDQCATSAAEAVRGAELVMLAVPLRAYRAIAAEIAPAVGAHTVVTDLGSVKGTMEALAGTLPAGRLVPGHPIAGGERSGAAVARGDLFRGKLCILTPGEAVAAEAIETVETLWHLAGADVLRMPTPVHDAIYAHVSHLPHAIAFVAAEALFHEGVRVTDDQEVLQRFLRISRSNPRMWVDVMLENREALLPAMATYRALLEHFVGELTTPPAAEQTAADTRLATQFLPRILASCLISGVSLYEQQSGMSLRPFGAGGMRDIVAPAATPPEADMEAISHAAPAMAQLLQRVIANFRHLEQWIGAEDELALFARISDMAHHAHALVTPRQ